jgi:hypothetical protein
VPNDERKETDDVSGAAAPAAAGSAAHRGDEHDAVDGAPTPDTEGDTGGERGEPERAPHEPDLDAVADAPPKVAELAAACVRFVSQRYGIMPDFTPETLSLVDQWVRDARKELTERPELEALVTSAAGGYLGEVIRRAFGARWFCEGDEDGWRLYLSTVYCAFNPIGMVREALSLEEAEGWHAHFELDPGEREGIEARLAALPEVPDDEYYAPSTRFDVVNIVVDALREDMRGRGLGDVRFTPEDYD